MTTSTQNATNNARNHGRSNSSGIDHDNGSGSKLLAGAAGFGLGLLAAAGRKAVVQAATFSAGDWFEGLKAEHKLARGMMEKLAETTDDEQAKRAPLVFALQHAIGKHNVQEEYVVYCVLAENDMTEEATDLNSDHFDMKQGLYELEQIGKEQRPGFLAKLAEIRTGFEAHVREEEDDIFPRLHAMLSDEQQKSLTSRMNREGFKVA
jgi:hemerythrin-like domain-containing protein